MPSSEEVAGPMVQTIFARRVIADLSVVVTCRKFGARRGSTGSAFGWDHCAAAVCSVRVAPARVLPRVLG